MGKADLHIHTTHSDGMATVPELLEYVEAATDLDIIAVVDHDDIRGAMATREAWARNSYRFQVVVGIEVTTIEGHILALFVEAPVPSLCYVEEALDAIHRQGGLAVIAHPLSWLTRSLDRKTIKRVVFSRREGVFFDGIEVANPSPAARVGCRKALDMNQHLGLAETGGSDAHFLQHVGSAHTEFEGRSGDDLIRAIINRETKAVFGRRASLREIGVRQIARQSLRGMIATPRAMGWGPTARSFVRRIFRMR